MDAGITVGEGIPAADYFDHDGRLSIAALQPLC